ncbi:hypothetical protein BN440_4088 [Erwinia amylovora MR1]|nr:hypothetical protein BN440_4088 [Erwinia amylovora MR1]
MDPHVTEGVMRVNAGSPPGRSLKVEGDSFPGG